MAPIGTIPKSVVEAVLERMGRDDTVAKAKDVEVIGAAIFETVFSMLTPYHPIVFRKCCKFALRYRRERTYSNPKNDKITVKQAHYAICITPMESLKKRFSEVTIAAYKKPNVKPVITGNLSDAETETESEADAEPELPAPPVLVHVHVPVPVPVVSAPVKAKAKAKADAGNAVKCATPVTIRATRSNTALALKTANVVA
jgi:nucleoid DNA-binding protein